MLDDILAGVQEDLVERQSQIPLETLQEQANARPSAKPAESALRDGETVKVIAEVKRSSPSKGALAAIADPAGLASDYEAGGACLISVLTEQRQFGGSLDDLAAARAAVDVPVLRKDFVVSSYQVWEARAHGADAVLLIVAALEQQALVSLVERVHSLGMTPLVEVHDEDEVARAVDAGARVIGVNARNLESLEVDVDAALARVARLAGERLAVLESGVTSAAHAATAASAGASAILVGETLMRATDPAAAIRDLRAAGAPPRADRTDEEDHA